MPLAMPINRIRAKAPNMRNITSADRRRVKRYRDAGAGNSLFLMQPDRQTA
jgi:hypothetical protein